MDAWDYCEAEIRVEGSLLGAKKWFSQITYFAANGSHRMEKMTTDFAYDPDRPKPARDAMGQVLAYLGQRGWELVRYQVAPDAQAREALLRRRTEMATT